jgi:hypothetical protein
MDEYGPPIRFFCPIFGQVIQTGETLRAESKKSRQKIKKKYALIPSRAT